MVRRILFWPQRFSDFRRSRKIIRYFRSGVLCGPSAGGAGDRPDGPNLGGFGYPVHRGWNIGVVAARRSGCECFQSIDSRDARGVAAHQPPYGLLRKALDRPAESPFCGAPHFAAIADHARRGGRGTAPAEAKYRSIFENAVEGIFQTTPDGHYLSANPALARIYGYDFARRS